MTYALYLGDCIETMRRMPEASVDAIVTDPPAGIGFMNLAFDSDRGGRDSWVGWFTEVSQEMFRLLKPGAWGFVWALPRTSHWTAWGLENAGFAIRDINHHLFGTGKPNSTDKAKIPEEWAGWNTALKGAAEHWILVRKDPEGTLAQNLVNWGVGALNIDAIRVARDDRYPDPEERTNERVTSSTSFAQTPGPRGGDAKGRWPANVTLSEEAAAELDASVGTLTSGSFNGKRNFDKHRNTYGAFKGTEEEVLHGSFGGPSRFWYIAKASSAERNAGCEYIPLKSAGEMTGGRAEGSAGLSNSRAGAGRTGGARNHHPTLKSIALMRRLTKTITPPGGIVLDPFLGSGTTGIAALAEGFRFIGIEKEVEYLAIANARIHHHQENP